MSNSDPGGKNKELCTEIESLKQTIVALKQFNGVVYSNLSHEIRTPLNGILGFSEIINDPDLSSEERQYYTGLIVESSNLLLSIITDVSDIAKISGGTYKVYPVTFDLNDLMFQLYLTYKPIAEKKELQLFLENVISTEFYVDTDTEVLQRVLKKLIDNALKFTRQGWVKFYYKTNEESVTFFVEDTGIGIQEEQRKNLFDRFTTQPVSQSRHLGGTGIDLSLCSGLVKLLGGEISLLPYSGEGSTFKFSIPR
ncbi:MAG: HAMP domain-containing histidine kinase [Bacteroidales bacterium]|nr:HAMP domain-containing histidine kinase [Bacteroidales bacterium]